MQVPLEIRFQNTDSSPVVEAAIRERVAKLERFAADIVSCRVTVEAPHRHHRHGKLFRVSVDVRLPGAEVRFREEAGERGPQASSVPLVGKHRPTG